MYAIRSYYGVIQCSPLASGAVSYSIVTDEVSGLTAIMNGVPRIGSVVPKEYVVLLPRITSYNVCYTKLLRLAICQRFDVKPADVCVQFGLAVPGIISIALNTGHPERIKANT